MERWRLLDVETPDKAAMNLAIEEAIFVEKIRNRIPPTVRFWRNRNAVVIGYSQNIEAEVNLEVCRAKGVEVVRRFSGGGAVYCDLGNLNYSLTIEAENPLIKGLDISETYRLFSSGIVDGLREFGVNLSFYPPSDLLADGRKISGNAQSRRKGAVFHHGTLLVNVDLDLLTQALTAQKEGMKNLKSTSKKRPVVNLEEVMAHSVEIEEVKRALWRGFERSFSVKLVPGILTREERDIAGRLHGEKYSREAWNFWR